MCRCMCRLSRSSSTVRIGLEQLGGYLDIGLIDTMKDLQVNCIGAIAFSIIGFFYVKHRGKGKLAAALIPVVLDPEKEKSKKDEQNREPNDE